MSDPRRKHIAAVERLVPGLASLRARLCPNHISEGTFWKIYLFLLHPKLGDHDSELLSTPKASRPHPNLLMICSCYCMNVDRALMIFIC